jgi:alkaline phosphatase D
MNRALVAVLSCVLVLWLGMLGGWSDSDALAQEAEPQQSALHSGPMLGYVVQRSATVWIQTKRAASAQLRYWPKGAPTQARLTAPQKTKKATDHCLTWLLDGLEPGTRYDYELFLEGKSVKRPYPLTFTTRPLWQWRTPPPETTLLLGSCSYMTEARFERPGRFYGGQYEIFTSMAKVKADAMLWLGDNVYLREVDWNSAEGIAARYRHDRAHPLIQALLAGQPNYATWDDHDFGPNNSDKTFPLKAASLKVFKRYWPAPVYGTPTTAGVFQRFRIADAEVFMTDGRYHRSPNGMPPGKKKHMLGRAQLEWLKASLVSSRATFKLIVTGNQSLNDVTPYEAWPTLFPQEQKELIDWIVERKIAGVVFVSGDRHHTEMLVNKPSGGYPLYEFTTSPLTSSAHKFRKTHPEWKNPRRVPGTLVQERNFGVIKIAGPAKDRKLVLEIRRVDGTRIWRQELKRSKLGWPSKRKGKLY